MVLKDSYIYFSILVDSSPGKDVIADHETIIVVICTAISLVRLEIPTLINIVEGDEWLDDGVEDKFG